MCSGPSSSSKREKPSRSSSAAAIPKSPTSGEDESSTDAGGGFVMAETVAENRLTTPLCAPNARCVLAVTSSTLAAIYDVIAARRGAALLCAPCVRASTRVRPRRQFCPRQGEGGSLIIAATTKDGFRSPAKSLGKSMARKSGRSANQATRPTVSR